MYIINGNIAAEMIDSVTEKRRYVERYNDIHTMYDIRIIISNKFSVD